MENLKDDLLNQQLNHIIDEMEPDIVKAVQESIRINSTADLPTEKMPFGTGPAAALQHALTLAENLGFHIENLHNAIGYAEFGKGDEMIAILGHLDVVPAIGPWKYPPFGGEVHDGILWGRGALDNKGPIIGALFAMKAIEASGVKLSRRIRVILGTNEESGSKDIYYYNSTQEAPVMGFTPDASFPVIFAEKGILTLSLSKNLDQRNGSVKLRSLSGGTAANIVPDTAEAIVVYDNGATKKYEGFGRAAHGSTPEKGENAIINLLKQLEGLNFCQDLKEFISTLIERIGGETNGLSMGIQMQDDKSGSLTLNLATINLTMDHENIGLAETIPAQKINAIVNIRYPVTRNADEILQIITRHAFKSGVEAAIANHKEPLYVKEDSELIKKLQSVYEQSTGEKAELLAIGGSTYAKAMKNIVAFGPIFPGQEDVTHQVNEHISIENLMKNIKIMAAAMYTLAQ